ncbi:MAG: lipopolysaccharide biosynthesis protein [Fusobacteriaceae bacterium]
MSKKTLNNIKLNLFITLFAGVLGFVSNKYFSKYMGVETLGLMRLFSELIAYLSLAELGIGTASTYALYEPLSERNNERINIVISTIDYFYKKVALFIFVLGIILNFAIPYFIKENNFGNYLYLYWSLYIINTSIGYLFAKYSILFTADQEYNFVRKIEGLGNIGFKILQIILIIYTNSFVLFILIMILENIYKYYFFRKHYEKKYWWIKQVKEKDKGILKDIKNLFWHKIGTLVVFNTDFIVLSKFISLSIVGIYSSYLIVIQLIMTIINVGTPVIVPIIGKFIAENTNNKDKIYDYWKRIYIIYTFISTIIIFCTYILINPFVKLWLGDTYLLPQLTVILILINFFIQVTRGPIEIFKTNSGFFDDTYAPALEAGINLVISLILVQRMGLNGVLIGTLASNVVVVLFLKPILTFKRCFEKSADDYIKDFSKNIISSLTVFLLLNLLFKKINLIASINSWTNFVISGFLIFILTTIVSCVVFLLNKDFRMNILKK